jgi:4-amino-4-deoxy-L-arabinose transferase-like glycosyltransferase
MFHCSARFIPLTLQRFNPSTFPRLSLCCPSVTNPAPFSSLRRWVLLGLFLALAINFAIRWHLRDMPLERDEGEYAYAGQLILQGILPYKLAFNMKFPGTYFMYALLMAMFGQSAAGIHSGIILITSLTALLIFFIGRELFAEMGALIAPVIYVCLAALPGAAGLAGHATHFVSLFVCAGAAALVLAQRRTSYVWWFISGLGFGLGILMKQHAVLFPGFILVWHIWNAFRRKEWQSFSPVVSVFCAGCLVPFLATVAGLALAGLWHAFIFWTFQYARNYVSMLPLRAAPEQFATGFDPIFESGIWAWIFGIVGLICVWRKPEDSSNHSHIGPGQSVTAGNPENQGRHPTAIPSPLPHGAPKSDEGGSDGRREGHGEVRVLAAIMFLAGLAAACPGFYFRSHYFLMAMPGLALLNAAFILTTGNIAKMAGLGGPGASRWLPLCLAGFIVGDLVVNNCRMWFDTTPAQLSKELYGGNPFAEALPVANYLKDHTSTTDTIAVLGSEPEIFFLSHRHSASGYIYLYALTEPQPLAPRMGREFVSQIETARPRYVVSVNLISSWYSLVTPESFRRAEAIQNWWAGYSTNYDLVGAVRIFPNKPSQFVWNEPALNNPAITTNAELLIYRRNQ